MPLCVVNVFFDEAMWFLSFMVCFWGCWLAKVFKDSPRRSASANTSSGIGSPRDTYSFPIPRIVLAGA